MAWLKMQDLYLKLVKKLYGTVMLRARNIVMLTYVCKGLTPSIGEHMVLSLFSIEAYLIFLFHKFL